MAARTQTAQTLAGKHAERLNSYAAVDSMTKYTMGGFYLQTRSSNVSVNGTVDLNDLYPVPTGAYYAEFGLLLERTLHTRTLYGQVNGFEFVSNRNGSLDTRLPISRGGLESMPLRNATFQLDTSVQVNTSSMPYSLTSSMAAMDPVPYNSTLRFSNGTNMALDAPFLNLSHGCGSWMRELGSTIDLCVCYQGSPLTSDFRTGDGLTCISEDGYVWGFAGVFTLIGILLEMGWIVGCFGMWFDAHIHSSLFRMNRRTSGLVRSILDVAGAVQRDLGSDTGAYSDDELRRALDKCAPIGYEVQTADDKTDRIGVVSVAGPRRRRRKLMRLAPDRLYA